MPRNTVSVECTLPNWLWRAQFGESVSFHELYIMFSGPTRDSSSPFPFIYLVLFLKYFKMVLIFFFCHSFKIVYYHCVWHTSCCVCGVQRTTFWNWFSFSKVDSGDQTQVTRLARPMSLFEEPSRRFFFFLLLAFLSVGGTGSNKRWLFIVIKIFLLLNLCHLLNLA